MKDKKFRVVMIVDLILLIAVFFLNLCGTIKSFQLQYLVNVIALVFALFYLIYGCKKKGLLFYKLFLAFITLKEASALCNMAFKEEFESIVPIVLELSMFSLALVLTTAKDYGAKKTYILSGGYVLVSLVQFISGLILLPFGSGVDSEIIFIYNLTRLILSLIIGVMVYAKYQDKYSRGSK